MDDTELASLLIRVSVGSIMVIFGISQVRHPEKWLKYIPFLVRFLMPLRPASFMRVHGLSNVSLGLILASGLFQPLSLWLVLLWWLWVSPFAFYYDFTVGLRDLAIIMALISLIILYGV